MEAFDPVIRALLAGAIISLIAPAIGTFMVLRRYSLVADSLAHVALFGVAIGLVAGSFSGIYPFLVTVAAAIFAEYLREYRRVPGEAALAMLLSGGLAAAITLTAAFGKEIDEHALFGAIETIAVGDVVAIVIAAGAAALALALFWKELTYASFDEEAARVQGVPVRFVNMLLMVLTALTVTFAIRLTGALLMGSLMVIPVIAAIQLGGGFRRTVISAVIISFVAVTVGIAIGAVAHMPPGGPIVLSAFALFFGILASKRVARA